MGKEIFREKFIGTIGDFIDDYYIPHYLSLCPKDLKNELTRISVIRYSDLAKFGLDELSHNDVITFLSNLQKERNLTKSTVNRYRSRISAILNYAMYDDYIFHNPMRKIKRHMEKPRSRALTVIEIKRLLSECSLSRNDELYTIVALALNTGMRRGEILSITMNNINLANRNILLEGRYTKSGESRLVPLNDTAVIILTKHIAHVKGQRLFTSKSIRNAFYYAMQRAEIEQARFHDLRRTFATHLKDAAIPLHTIMKLLGHSSISMTERYLSTQDAVLFDGVSKIDFN